MNNKIFIYALLILFLFSFSENTYAQSKLKNAEKELKKVKNLLKSLDRKSTKTLTKFKVRKRQIELYEVLLGKIKNEILSLELKIKNNQNKKVKYEKEIKRLKYEYEELILYAYKTRNSRDKTMYIFSSKIVLK